MRAALRSGYPVTMNAAFDGPPEGNATGAIGQGPALDRPGTFRIQVLGVLRPEWSVWFGGFTLSPGRDETGQAVTELIGEVVDQSALYGVLERIRDLGLSLLLVEQVNPEQPGD